ncbi:MAG: FixH family protein [Chloroflexota bacterium]
MRASRLWLALVVIGVLALVAACTPAAPRQAEKGTGSATSNALDAAQATLAPPGPTLGGQRSGDLLVWLASNPEKPRRGEAKIDAYLVGTDGQPVSDAKVTFDTDMTNMSHGPNLVKAAPTANGHYVGQVRFSMPGPWRVITVVERPGKETLRLRFEFGVSF